MAAIRTNATANSRPAAVRTKHLPPRPSEARYTPAQRRKIQRSSVVERSAVNKAESKPLSSSDTHAHAQPLVNGGRYCRPLDPKWAEVWAPVSDFSIRFDLITYRVAIQTPADEFRPRRVDSGLCVQLSPVCRCRIRLVPDYLCFCLHFVFSRRRHWNAEQNSTSDLPTVGLPSA